MKSNCSGFYYFRKVTSKSANRKADLFFSLMMVLILPLTLVGCVTAGTGSPSGTLQKNLSFETPPAGSAEVVMYRVNRSMFGSDNEYAFLRDVIWTVNGQRTGEYSGSGFLKLPAAPGTHKVNATLSDRPRSSADLSFTVQSGQRVFLRYTWTGNGNKSAEIHVEGRETALGDLKGMGQETALVQSIGQPAVAPAQIAMAPTQVSAVAGPSVNPIGCIGHAVAMMQSKNNLFVEPEDRSRTMQRTLRFSQRNNMDLIKGYKPGTVCHTIYTMPKQQLSADVNKGVLNETCNSYAEMRQELKAKAAKGLYQRALNEQTGWMNKLLSLYDHGFNQYCLDAPGIEIEIVKKQDQEIALKELRKRLVSPARVKGYALKHTQKDETSFLELIAVDPESKRKTTRYPGGYSFYRLQGINPGDLQDPQPDESCFMGEGWACSKADGDGEQYAYRLLKKTSDKKTVMDDYRWFFPAKWGGWAPETQIIQGRVFDGKSSTTIINDLVLVKTISRVTRYLRIDGRSGEEPGLKVAMLSPGKGLDDIVSREVFSGPLDDQLGYPQGEGRCEPMDRKDAVPFNCQYSSGRIVQTAEVAEIVTRQSLRAVEIKQAFVIEKCEGLVATAIEQASSIQKFDHDRLTDAFDYVMRGYDKAMNHWNSEQGVSAYRTIAMGYPAHYDSQGNGNAKEAGEMVARELSEMVDKLGPKYRFKNRLAATVRKFESDTDCHQHPDLAEQIDATKPMIKQVEELESHYRDYVREASNNARRAFNEVHENLSRGAQAQQDAGRRAQFMGIMNTLNKWNQDLAATQRQQQDFLKNLQAMQRRSQTGQVYVPPMAPGATPLPTQKKMKRKSVSAPKPVASSSRSSSSGTSTSSRSNASDSASTTPGSTSSRRSAREEELGNTSVTMVTGKSGAFFADRSHARNLAQLQAQQNAGSLCKSTKHAKVVWVDNGCKMKADGDNKLYRCFQRAEIHCQARACPGSYCGTGVR